MGRYLQGEEVSGCRFAAKALRPTFVSREFLVNTLGMIRREGRGGGNNVIDFQLFYVKPFSEPITQIYLILIHI